MADLVAAELANTPIFAGLDQASLDVLVNWIDSESVHVGQELTHEGSHGYAFFVLHEGTAEVLVDHVVVRTLGPNDYFGEISILGTGRQTATVRVTSAGTVWTMFGTRFRQLQIEHPEIAATIEATANERLHAQDPPR
jgi:CRP/FNR family transcriptional regulator, cyclic AMP receptor protein